MAQRSLGEACCREVLDKRVVETCWGRVFQRSVGGGSCREVLGKRVVQNGEVLENSAVEMCWRSVL